MGREPEDRVFNTKKYFLILFTYTMLILNENGFLKSVFIQMFFKRVFKKSLNITSELSSYNPHFKNIE